MKVWSEEANQKAAAKARRMLQDKQRSRTLRQAFELFDLDGGGSIESGELHTLLKGLGIQTTQQETLDILNEVKCAPPAT